MRALLIAASIAALAPATVLAQASTNPAEIKAGNYKVESYHTLAQFGVVHFGFNTFFGTIPGATGTLSLNPAALGATKLDVTLPVSGISTTNPKLDGELKGADWFDSAQYPDIHFVSTKVVKTGARTAQIIGTLTMHGVSKPVTLDASFGGAGINPLDKAYTVGFAATGHIKRSEFGISKYVPLVSDDVTLTISAAFEKTN